MNLINLFEIDCIYTNIIKFLNDNDTRYLRLTCKRLNNLLIYGGYLKYFEFNCGTLEELVEHHNMYMNHKRFIKYVYMYKETDPFCSLPKLNNCILHINTCNIFYHNKSIDNISTLVLTECNVDLYQISLCKNLKCLSIYNTYNKNIKIEKQCIFKKLETLLFIGDINLKKIVANKLTTCFLKLKNISDTKIYHFKKLRYLFCVCSCYKTNINIDIHKIYFIGIIYKEHMYCNNIKNINNNYTNIFLNNCNFNNINTYSVNPIHYINQSYFIK